MEVPWPSHSGTVLAVIPTYNISWLSVGPLFPEANDLKGDSRHEGRTAVFVLACIAALFTTCLVLELLAAIQTRPLSTYSPLLGGGGGGEDEGQDEKQRDFTMNNMFASFVTLYHCLCWGVALAASTGGFVSQRAGLDYEYYFLWLLAMMLLHITCFLARPGLAPASGQCSLAVLKSVAPLLSEPLDGLRDAVLATVYIGAGPVGYVPALLVLLGVVMPCFGIFKQRAAFETRKSYWPMLFIPDRATPEEDSEQSSGWCSCTFTCPAWSKVSQKLLDLAKEQTDPLKRYLVIYEENHDVFIWLLGF